MRKILYCAFCIIFLMGISGCQTTNPYDNLPPNVISQVNSQVLCNSVNNRHYLPSVNVLRALTRRGYKDCSESETYCRETLGLQFGTKEYNACRMRRDEFNLQREQMNQQAALQYAAIDQANKPVNVYVHNGNYPVYGAGYRSLF